MGLEALALHARGREQIDEPDRPLVGHRVHERVGGLTRLGLHVGEDLVCRVEERGALLRKLDRLGLRHSCPFPRHPACRIVDIDSMRRPCNSSSAALQRGWTAYTIGNMNAPTALPHIERTVSELGAKVARERSARGWSLAQLAQRVGALDRRGAQDREERHDADDREPDEDRGGARQERRLLRRRAGDARRQRGPRRRAGARLHVQAGPRAAQPLGPLRRLRDGRRRGARRAARRQRADADEPPGRGAGDRARGPDGVRRRRRPPRARGRRLDPLPRAAAALVEQPERRARAGRVARGASVVYSPCGSRWPSAGTP